MKKIILSGLSLAILSVLAWAIMETSQAKQNSAVAIVQQGCQSPFYPRKEKLGEGERLSNESAVIDLEAMRQVNEKAFLEAGESGDKSLIPYLEFLADARSNSGALVALIKLGDTQRFNKLVNLTRCVEGEFDDKDYTRQNRAIELLAQVKTPAANRALYSLLDDTEPPPQEDHSILMSRSEMVMYQLSQTVNPLPAELDAPDVKADYPRTDRARAIWKKWFEKNGLN